jgi:tripartite-type tricarboxylate transporter receptor subunit TctC
MTLRVALGLRQHRGDAPRVVALPHGREARRPAADARLRSLEVAVHVTIARAACILALPYFPAMAAAGIVVDDEPVMHGERADKRQRRITQLDYQGKEKGVRAIFLLHIRVVFLAAILINAASAQDWPAKPLRIIVPFAPGGVADSSARVVAEPLGMRLGQPVLVENRPGASGNIGTQAVAAAPADGYTLLLGFDGTMVINPHVFPRVPFDTLMDFAPVTKLGDATLILVAHPSLPAKNLQALIELARSKPLAYGTSGTGGTPHLAGELLKLRTGAQLEHVPYKGGGQAIVDVVGGQIPLVFTAIATAQQYVRTGRLVALGVPSAKRSAALPDVPTFEESGLAGFDVTSWVGIFAPAKTPGPVIERLYKELALVLRTPFVKERYGVLGIEPVGNPPREFFEQVRDDLARWRKVVKAANIKVE